MWKKEISKDEINELDLKAWEGEIVLIDDEESIPSAVQEILKEKYIGIDTETKPTFKKGKLNSVALIQVAIKNKVFLFRINKTGFHPALTTIFERKNIIKIGIAVKHDIIELQEIRAFKANNIIDLNEYCAKIGRAHV